MIQIRAWDLAATTGTDSDYTAGVLMARVQDGTFYILDVVHGRWTPHERDKRIAEAAERDGRFTRIVLEEEGGSAGKHQAQYLIRMLAGYDVRAVRPTGDKITRAVPFSAQLEAGNIRLFRAPWNVPYLNELESFPEGLHDDLVDASAMALNELAALPQREKKCRN